jgi:transposase
MKAAKKVKTITKTVVPEAVAAVGIDLGDRWSHWCSLSSTGEVIDRGRVKTSAEALSELSIGWARIPVD